MHVPLTTLDFLERAESVFADRVAVIDEPAPPGGGLWGAADPRKSVMSYGAGISAVVVVFR